MPEDFAIVFSALRRILAPHAKRLSVKADTSAEYTLETKSPSPFPQHKGQPLFFGSVRIGKAYVSFHLMPLYMCPKLAGSITPALKKWMQGKACFNFKVVPDKEIIADLGKLARESMSEWAARNWL